MFKFEMKEAARKAKVAEEKESAKSKKGSVKKIGGNTGKEKTESKSCTIS